MVDVIVRQFPLIVSAFCAVILVVLVVALIFRPQFRQDLLSAESEASLLRIVSIKGVALLTFISLFVFGTIYPVWVYSEHCKDAPHERRGVSSGIRLIEDYIQSRVPVAIRPYVEPVAEDLQDSLGRLDEGTVMIYGKYAGSTPAKDKLVEMPPGSTVLATHVPAKARGLEDMYAWDKPPLSSFFRLNVQMIKSGVKIRRIFILRKEDLVDPDAGCIKDRRSVQIMQKHEQNGVEVFVTWFKDIERKRDIEDFIIFGNELVQVNESAWSKEGHDKIMLSVNRHLLSAYKHRWKTWRADGRTLKEAFRQLREASGKKDIYCEVQ